MTDLGIGLTHVTTAPEAEVMRVIRNSCRQFMTGSQREITVDEQQFWFEINRGSRIVHPFLFGPRPFQRQAITAFGFGLVRLRVRGTEWQWIVSGGLAPDYRGKGYGLELFGQLTTIVHGMLQPAWLDVFEDNVSARHVYERLGYVEHSVTVDGAAGSRPIITMRKDPPPP